MEFTIKVEGVEEALKRFDNKKVMQAAKAALRETIKSGKVEASRAIRQDLGFNIRKSDIDRKINLKVADVRGEISVTGEPIIMSYFNPTQILGGVKTAIKKVKGRGASAFKILQGATRRKALSGVQVEIIKGKRTTLRGGQFMGGVKVKGAFIGRGKGGTPMVFGNIQGPVTGLHGGHKWKLWGYKVFSEHFMFKKVMNKVIEKVKQQWPKEWQNQFNRFFK